MDYRVCPEVAVTVSTRSIYVKLTIYTVNQQIYRNTSTNPNPNPNPILSRIYRPRYIYISVTVCQNNQQANKSQIDYFLTDDSGDRADFFNFRDPFWT